MRPDRGRARSGGSLAAAWRRAAVLLAALLLAPHASSQQPPRQAVGDEGAFVGALLARMTVEEKLGQLVQYSGRWAVTGPAVPQGGDEEIRAGRVGSFLNLFGREPTCTAQRVAVEQSRLGVPLLFAHDVVHGFRTIFPIPLGEAAAFDPDLAEQTARVGAREASAAGLHWTFAPMVDIARDARWGRITEGAGEDAFLASAYAAARVRGFQGPTPGGLASDTTVLATAKHFVAYGAAEGGRDYATAEVSERALQTVYLPPFQAAIDAGAETVMAAFNDVAGVPAHASRRLLTDVLRGQMGFRGLVVSDYTGVRELLQHGVAADSAAAGRLALHAGVDVDMVDGIYIKNLVPLVASGAVSAADLDEAVRRVLRAKWRAGLFADPYRYCRADREPAPVLTASDRRLARRAAVRSIVLLKNDAAGGQPVLPLSKALRSVAVVGALAADSASALGSWAGIGRAGDAVTILDGLRQALPGAEVRYAPGYPVAPQDFQPAVDSMLSRNTSGHAEAEALARGADAVVLVLGEHRQMTGEAASRTDIGLPGAQMELFRRVQAAAAGKPVVVVLTNGRSLALEALDAEAPAIVEAWHLGVEMGTAVADVLLGDADPGGRLPATFPRTTGQVPISYDMRPTGRPPADGSKYNAKWIDTDVTPLYPFGYGLSYTTFEMSGLALDRTTAARDASGAHLAAPVRVSVTVTNTGARAGDETVQVYLEDEVASVAVPRRRLAGFRRVTLQPGEAQTLTFDLADQTRLWGIDDAWTVEPGFFTVHVGRSSADTPLTARFDVR